MDLKVADNLSYFTKPGGVVTPVMPDSDPTFNLSEIRAFVGEQARLACVTREGYVVVHDPSHARLETEINEFATSLYAAQTGSSQTLHGNVFLIHPNHVDREIREALSQPAS